jgi:SET domain-containing protein
VSRDPSALFSIYFWMFGFIACRVGEWNMTNARDQSGQIRHKSAQFRLWVGRSRIHGKGVFALEDISVGRCVIEYTGKRLGSAQTAKLKPADEAHVITTRLGHPIDGRVRGSGAQFINHSCDPNLEPRERHGRIFFFARRPIRAREELTIYFEYPFKATRLPCLCGARKCRKTLRYVIEE